MDVSAGLVCGPQVCSELMPEEFYFTSDGVTDMFWDQPLNLTAMAVHCESTFGISPRVTWMRQQYGDMSQIADGASRIGTRPFRLSSLVLGGGGAACALRPVRCWRVVELLSLCCFPDAVRLRTCRSDSSVVCLDV